MGFLCYVCILAPAALSAALFERLVCRRSSPLLFVELYLSLLGIVNLVPLLLLFLGGRKEEMLPAMLFTVGFCVKYLAAALLTAAALPLLGGAIRKFVHAELVVERHVEAPDEPQA